MKKIYFSLIAVAMLAVILTGCGKSKPAKEVDKLIENLGEITLESDDAITEAEEYYDTLTEKQKNQVDNYKALVDARKAYDELLEAKRIEEEKERQKQEVVDFEKELFELKAQKAHSQADIDRIVKQYESFSEEQKGYMQHPDVYEEVIAFTDYEKAAICAVQQLRSSLKNKDSLKLKSVEVVSGTANALSPYYAYICFSASNSFGGMQDSAETIDVSSKFTNGWWSFDRGMSMLGGGDSDYTKLQLYNDYINNSTDSFDVDCERIMQNIDENVSEKK